MNAEQAKLANIVDMALGFTAMTMVFEVGSATRIALELGRVLPRIAASKSEQQFRELHHGFGQWFARNIKTAERTSNGLVTKKSGPASYGQGAKVLDVSLKCGCTTAGCRTVRLLARRQSG